MALKTELARRLPLAHPRRGVDGWLFNQLTLIKGDALNVHLLDSDGWRLGIDSHGLNQISRRRGEMMATATPPFRRWEGQLEAHVPADIAARLRELGR